jgi:diketogulonate reductase-like aldo/keto reductase
VKRGLTDELTVTDKLAGVPTEKSDVEAEVAALYTDPGLKKDDLLLLHFSILLAAQAPTSWEPK